MRRFNGRNFLPFDVFSDHLLHRDALQTTLKVRSTRPQQKRALRVLEPSRFQ